ncbi:hypothetical protein GSI_15628 [Ganoderma sinense ZZ0214-1]|uniref:Uncharacterized protein n=1 Tax=Ganoderma sinense ZZ0214-1 TaxID=1077348 RepID=A0A2G8RN38_9APHY|nr:hypothetical protein GSI_15628 [Ganoderma sinense ZZ0214-1]
MPTAPVDQHGSVLYYEDSGVPGTSTDYVTLVLVHGTCFHSEQHNLRLVLLNLRGYPGSTPYSEEELKCFEGSAEEAESAVRARGLEVAAFLRWFIEAEKIPEFQDTSGSDSGVGGLSLLSWSGGNCQTLSMFANADTLPEDTRNVLNGYLRSFIISQPHCGRNTGPPGMGTAFFNPSLSPEEQALRFALAVSSYYPPFTLPDKIDGDTATYAPRVPLQDPKYVPTTVKLTEAELRGLVYPAIFQRVQPAMWSPALPLVYQSNASRALCDCRLLDGGSGPKKVWPGVKVHLVWCDMTGGDAAWAASVFNCKYKEADPAARRPMEVHKVEGANHFIHWEEPQRFIELLAKLV